MSKIFISYRREDSGGYAGRLHEALAEQFGKSQVFMDTSDIAPGADFPTTILKTLEQSSVALILIGKHWASTQDDEGRQRLAQPDDYVAMEVRTALKQVQHVIPLLVGDAEMPEAEELPAEIGQLLRKNAFELTPTRWDYDFERLAEQLDKYLVPVGPIGVRWRPLALAVGLAFLVSISAWWTDFFRILPGYSNASARVSAWMAPFAESQLAEDRLALIVDERQDALTAEDRAELRSNHAELLGALAMAGARVVAFDYFLEDSLPSDVALSTSIRAAEEGGTAVVLGFRRFADLMPDLAPEFRQLPMSSLGLIRLGLQATDAPLCQIEVGQLRANPQLVDPAAVAPSLPLLAVMRYWEASRAQYRGSSGLIELISPRSLVVKSLRTDPNLRLTAAIQRSSGLDEIYQEYSEALGRVRRQETDFLRRKFGGRIVIVGSRTEGQLTSPPGLDGLYGFQIHTLIASALLLDRYLQPVGTWFNLLALLLSSTAGGLGWFLENRLLSKSRFLASLSGSRLRPAIGFAGGAVPFAFVCLVGSLIVFKTSLLLLPTFYYIFAFSASYILLWGRSILRPSEEG